MYLIIILVIMFVLAIIKVQAQNGSDLCNFLWLIIRIGLPILGIFLLLSSFFI